MLRKHFGISALEALNGLPAWEVDLLMEGIAAEHAPPLPPPVARERTDPVQLAKELDRLG